jgi:amino acid adenylation domain-containing protein
VRIEELLQAYKEGQLSTSEIRSALKKLRSAANWRPLSERQKGLWALNKLAPKMTAYNVPVCLRIHGTLDRVAFERSCLFVQGHYPVLTNIIDVHNGIPHQRSRADGALCFQHEDVSLLDADEILHRLRAKTREPFSLEQGPLMRVTLFSKSATEHVLLIVIHHIIFDGRSIPLFLKELFEAYECFRTAKLPATALLSANYDDFVDWERQYLESEAAVDDRRYWMQQLSGSLPVLELPTDHPRSSSQEFDGQTYTRALPAELAKQVREFCLTRSINVPAVFLSTYKAILARYSGQKDIIVGMPTLGRPEDRFDTMIGYFVNMVALRSYFSGHETFFEICRVLQSTLADALDHANYPFSNVVRDLKIQGSRHAPIFQVAFEYQNWTLTQLAGLGTDSCSLSAEWVNGVHQEGEYELVLEVSERVDDFILNLKYNPRLYDSSTIVRMVDQFVQLLRCEMGDPDRNLRDYSLLSSQELDTIVHQWNATQTIYADVPVCDLFRQQAKLTPSAIAVAFEQESLTYQELDEKSGRVASLLFKQGVRPDDVVAIYNDRSIEMMICLLGVLKSGAAYLPLDPEYPAERLKYMIEDSRSRIVMSPTHMVSRVEALVKSDVNVVVVDRALESIESLVELKTHLEPAHLAYVMYTSGSSGKPKGVMIPHRALTNFLLAMNTKLPIGPQDRLLAITTFSFDISGLELYLPIISGAQCIICSREAVQDCERLKKEIQRVKPTIMQATPATWSVLFQAGWKNEEKIKILCGGEALPESLRKHFIDTDSQAWNMFGPTETTIWSTMQQITSTCPISIGKPIANTKAYILDEDLRPVPIGVPGELCIGGDGLARGYLNQPRLTAEKFVDNPFVSGSKVYKTGDLARWRDDGTIECLGRTDSQVKLRGYRIELDEVESRLIGHPEIQLCAAVVREMNGTKQLVAFCVMKPGADKRPCQTPRLLEPRQFRRYLKEVLPDYMIPSGFVEVDGIPLTVNGKIDRNRLETITLNNLVRTSLAARSDIEDKVIKVWQTVLNVHELGVEDGFFEVGGDSIMAVTVAELIGSAFQINFTVTDLFNNSTVRKIADYISEVRLKAPPVATVSCLAESPAPVSEAGKGPRARLNRAPVYPDYYQNSVAIIGMSCRFPGAQNCAAFWQNLREGRESIVKVPSDELQDLGVPKSVPVHGTYVPVRASVLGKDGFDAEFFKISPREAQAMDPQLRLLLQHSWAAVEDAGYSSKDLPDTGVFMCASTSFYQMLGAEDRRNPLDYQTWLLAQQGTIPAIVSYKLGLKGPSFSVHSNCSSSLVALSVAYNTVIRGDSKYALVGAASLFPFAGAGYVHEPGLNLSSDGHVRAFDAAADGMVSGEGVAVILLKRAMDAVEEGDHIYALLRGIAVNNDGGEKVGFYAPSVKGQSAVIRKVLSATKVNPETISYVEAHGTGTQLGDPIEVAALSEAYRSYTSRTQFCGIGSVKTNIGHSDTAAGLAGCIKVVLSLFAEEIPASLNYSRPNANIDLVNSPFYVTATPQKWNRGSTPPRAALSSFGIGGTNVHAVFEQYQPGAKEQAGIQADAELPQNHIVPLSAKNADRLRVCADNLCGALASNRERLGEALAGAITLPNLAYTLQVGREAMAVRVAFVVSNIAELVDRLNHFVKGNDSSDHGLKAEVTGGGETKGIVDADDARELVRSWIASAKLDKLASAWVKGFVVDWQELWRGKHAQRISLPTYPFFEEHYWISNGKENPVNRASDSAAAQTALPHGLREPPGSFSTGKPREVVLSAVGDVPVGGSPIPLKPAYEEHGADRGHSEADGTTSVAQQEQFSVLSRVQKSLKQSLAKALYLGVSEIDEDKPFVDLGLDSIVAVEWVRVINGEYSLSMPATKLYDFPTISQLARYVSDELLPQAGDLGTPGAELTRAGLLNKGFQEQSGAAAPEKQDVAVQDELTDSLADALYLERAAIDVTKSFVELGMDSIIGVEWVRTINQRYGLSISATKLYDYPTIAQLAAYILSQLAEYREDIDQTALHVTFSEQRRGELVEGDVGAVNREQSIHKKVLGELRASLGEALFVSGSDIDESMSFVDLGLDSIIAVEWIRELNRNYNLSMPATKLYDYPTLIQLAQYVSRELKTPNADPTRADAESESTDVKPIHDILQGVFNGTISEFQAKALLEQHSVNPLRTRDTLAGNPRSEDESLAGNAAD